tara:strand:+ start:1762 stop:2415 length:654 start_codon:yes stop_codon:yes gene_type:complete
MINAVIFDMDGLLVDSEPTWRKVEIACFAKVGLTLTEDDCKQTMGLRIDEVVDYWFEKHPWEGMTTAEMTTYIVDEMERELRENAVPMPGVMEVIQQLKNEGYKMAIASSSQMRLIDAVMEKLDLDQLIGVRCSAETEDYGKPHPAVFITAAHWMNTNPENCVVFEDSLHGVVAAKAAKMKCIAVPDEVDYKKPQFAIADQLLKSLKDFDLNSILGW